MSPRFLIQILMPLKRGDGTAVTKTEFDSLAGELTERFGGVTNYLRAPADGWWDGKTGKEKDEIVIVEVMAEEVEEVYWAGLRKQLERTLGQDCVIIRAQAMRTL